LAGVLAQLLMIAAATLIGASLHWAATHAGIGGSDGSGLLAVAAAGGLAVAVISLAGWWMIRRPFDRMAAAIQAREAAPCTGQTRLELAAASAGIGLWEWDLSSDAACWSDQQWRLHGLDPRPGGIAPHKHLASIHPDDRERFAASVQAAIATPSRRVDTAYRVLHPDRGTRWLLARAAVVPRPEGGPGRVVGLSLDVTESREREARLRRLSVKRAARLRDAIVARNAAQARAAHAERLQALGQLAAGIAHDFNNVLQAIMTAAALIERRSALDGGIHHLAQLTLEAAERGATITRRMLSLGRSRTGLNAEQLDANALLLDLRLVLSHTLGPTIAVEVGPQARYTVLSAEKGQLETALINLAVNARDAMPGGGRLALSTTNIEVAEDDPLHPAGLAPGRYIGIVVTDTGLGMDAETLRRATEPFFTTKGVGIGTGLGLSIVKGFAEHSGGGLSVVSSLGAGTTVTLWLPEAAPALPHGTPPRNPPAPAMAEGGAEPAPGDAAPAHARALVVDDDEATREVLAEHLEETGFRVLTAKNGTEALRCFDAGETIDILVTDLSMPEMDGLALIRTVQARCPGLPAVLLTGYDSEDASLAVQGALSGSFSLLHKPVRAVQFIARIQSLLARQTGASRCTNHRN